MSKSSSSRTDRGGGAVDELEPRPDGAPNDEATVHSDEAAPEAVEPITPAEPETPAPEERDPHGAHDPDIDRKTLLWAMAGDDSAFARLIQHYDGSLRTLVFRQVERVDLMDRVLASTYLKAYRALPRLKSVAHPGAWLSGIAAKACAAELRRESQRVRSRRISAEPPTGETPVGVSHRVDPVNRQSDAATPTLRPKPAKGTPGLTHVASDDDGGEGVSLVVPTDPDEAPRAEPEGAEVGAAEAEAAEGEGEAAEAEAAEPEAAETSEATEPAAAAAAEPEAPEPKAAVPEAAEAAEPEAAEPKAAEPEAAEPEAAETAEAETAEPEAAEPPEAEREAHAASEAGEGDPAEAEVTEPVVADGGAPDAEGDADPGDRQRVEVEAATPGPGPAGAPKPAGALPIPDHLPDFWNKLGRQLLAEREVPARPAPTAEQIRAARAASSPSSPPATRNPRARKSKPSEQRDHLERPASVGELAQRVKPPERRGFAIGRQVLTVVVVVGAIAAIAFAAFRIGGSAQPINRDGMTAGKLAGQITATLDQSTTIVGAFTHAEYAPDGQKLEATYDLTYASNGSYRLHGTNLQVDSSYNATTGVRRERSQGPGPNGTTQVRQVEAAGLATGPPDPSADINQFFESDLATVLAEMREQGETTVESTRFAGRPSWRVSVDLPGGEGTPDQATLLVDKQLLVPSQLTLGTEEGTQREYSLTNVALDQPVEDSTFEVVFSDEPVERTDEGFERVTLDNVSTILGGYRPATPSFLPEGYELAEVAVHEGRGGRTGPNGINPPSFNVVSLTYRRGWEAVTVTTRSNTAEEGQQWFDPFASAEPVPPSETVRLESGRYRLVEAQRVVVPGRVPHLWGVTGDVLFTVSGDLNGDELVQVAESIRP